MGKRAMALPPLLERGDYGGTPPASDPPRGPCTEFPSQTMPCMPWSSVTNSTEPLIR